MEFKEIKPEQDNWVTQKVLSDYYGSHRLGSLIIDTDGDYYVEIDGKLECSFECDTWEDAEQEFFRHMQEHFEDERNYYDELHRHLDEFMDSYKVN